MLEYALSKTPRRLTVMALWNGEAGDGPGGTADLLETATALGATPSVIGTGAICGVAAQPVSPAAAASDTRHDPGPEPP
jgi:hypothetical protein